jgi:SAM-dependent methyltransferase
VAFFVGEKGHEGRSRLEAGVLVALFVHQEHPMNEQADELARYDRARRRLRLVVADRLPPKVDPEPLLTAYAYWVCGRVNRWDADWEETLREYADIACRCAGDESEAERRELALLRRELARARGPVLDVGAGWGRLAPLYADLGLSAVYVEPERLGTQLMRRSGLPRVVCSVGEALPFAAATFATIVVGWVLHHDASGVDAMGIVREVGRMVGPGGRLLSIEPLDSSFDVEKWMRLLHSAGFEVDSLQEFFQMPDERGAVERYTLAIARR